MLTKKELKLIRLIKFTPILIVGIICIIITLLLYIDKSVALENDLKTLKDKYLEKNRIIIQNEVEKIYQYVNHKKLNSEDELKEDIKVRVLEAHSIMTYIYEKYKNTETKEQITSRIKDSLVSLRFNKNRGYFYINTLDGVNILHPLNERLENSNILNHQDIRGVKIVQNILENFKNSNEAFTQVYWEKPEDLTKQYKKITFNKVFEPYNWFIGTGEYVDDFEDEVKKEILSYINSIRYSKNGYIFVVDKEGNYLAHIAKDYIGLNRIDLKDPNGFMITKEIINLANVGEGFLKYVGTIKPETKLPAEKISYVKGFKDWQWAIATGFYTDELEKQIIDKEKEFRDNYMHNLVNLFVVSTVLSIIFLFISFYISKKLERRFFKYRQQVLSHIKKDRQRDSMMAQQAKMAAMGEMLENIAHQWRQPLSAISTIATGVKIQYEYETIEKQQIMKSMDSISSTTKYLSQTIDDFRDYFNPNKEAGYFNLEDIFKKSFDLLEIELNLKNIKIIKNLQTVYIYGFQNEFLQVIINILNNSKDEFIKLEQNKKYIFIDLKQENSKAIITIKDNAGGIDEKIINKVFEPYFSTKFASKGTGIGLYMSKQIVEKHMNGKIEVLNETYDFESQSHTGACFEIVFPLEEKTI